MLLLWVLRRLCDVHVAICSKASSPLCMACCFMVAAPRTAGQEAFSELEGLVIDTLHAFLCPKSLPLIEDAPDKTLRKVSTQEEHKWEGDLPHCFVWEIASHHEPHAELQDVLCIGDAAKRQ